MEGKVVTLKEPISVRHDDGRTERVSEVRIDRLRGKHLRAFRKDILSAAAGDGVIEPAEILPIVSKITEIPEEVVNEMDLEDIFAIWEVISDFFEVSLATGKRSSGPSRIRTTSNQR